MPFGHTAPAQSFPTGCPAEDNLRRTMMAALQSLLSSLEMEVCEEVVGTLCWCVQVVVLRSFCPTPHKPVANDERLQVHGGAALQLLSTLTLLLLCVQRRYSVAKIDVSQTYEQGRPKLNGLSDPRLGTMDRAVKCTTDGANQQDSPGYFGHIELAKPVFHCGFITTVIKVLRCVSYHSSKLLIDKVTPPPLLSKAPFSGPLHPRGGGACGCYPPSAAEQANTVIDLISCLSLGRKAARSGARRGWRRLLQVTWHHSGLGP